MRCIFFALALISVAAALPLNGEETSALQVGMFPIADDEKTVSAEVDEAIQHDVNMDDIGESPEVDNNSSWEKKAAADIDAMSKSEISRIHATMKDDSVVDKFQHDINKAKQALAGPKKKINTESEIEKEADEALKNPANEAKLRKEAEEAEVDMESGFLDPVAFIDTSSDDSDDSDDLGEDVEDFLHGAILAFIDTSSDDSDDLGEDDDDDSDFQLMGGSDADIAKAIEQRIGQHVSAQLGSIPVQTGDVDSLKQFEQDKVEAEKFISTKKVKAKQDIASKQIMEEMAAAQKELKESQESNEELDKREDTDEGDERTKA